MEKQFLAQGIEVVLKARVGRILLPDPARRCVINQMVHGSFPFPLRNTWGDWPCARCEHCHGGTGAVGVGAVPAQTPLCGLVFARMAPVTISL